MPEVVGSALKLLKEDPRFNPCISHIETIPRREPVFGKLAKELPPNIKKYLAQKKIVLYEHQCEAIELLRGGKNIIITTPTASGKTLAFNIPVFEALENDKQGTALYLYPTKALSNDQLKVVREFERLSGIEVDSDIYDGDTPQGKRPKIRENSRIIMSNPFELHLILPWHTKWKKFLSNLKYVIIDEAHRYRGVFGSNFAFLVRRLRRLCSHYKSFPQFVLSSATLANPIEFSQKLIGEKFSLISEDKSPKGKKCFILFNPFYKGEQGSSTHEETKNLFLFFVKSGLQTICFTISRRMAELIASWTKRELEKSNSILVDKIASYRAGYLPEERRDIEIALKNGVIRGITSTNALELGIDIGSLDCVIISGFPGTLISTWQQAGRSGRGVSESVAVLVAFQNPLDQYLMKHPEMFFDKDKPIEHAIIDLENPYIISGHLLCASAEQPVLTSEDRIYFNDDPENILRDLAGEGLVQNTARGWVYSGRGRPHEAVSLENISASVFNVVCEGELLETMDRGQTFREGHKGAVILHQGETYIVQDLDLKNNLVKAKKEDVDYFTQPVMVSNVRVIEEFDRRKIGDFTLYLGEVDATEQYIKYKIKKFDRIIGMGDIDLPPLKLKTTGFWWTIPARVENKIEQMGLDFVGSIHGVEHALINLLPFRVMCDAWDLGGVSTDQHPDTGKATIFVYESIEGGIGLCEKGFEIFGETVKMTLDLVQSCSCQDGCPACIISPRCGNENRPLDKKGTVILLQELLKSFTHATRL